MHLRGDGARGDLGCNPCRIDRKSANGMGGGLHTHHAMWGLGDSVRLAFGQSGTLCAQRIGYWDPLGLGIGFDGFQAV